MDISSGDVVFGATCPGSLMKQLQEADMEHVRKITKLQTSFCKGDVTYLCPLGCGDLNIPRSFIESIDALQNLSVLNYEADTSSLWPAIFHHAKTLENLAIHTPPQKKLETWTHQTIREVATGLPQLKHLELDVELYEAELYLKNEAHAATPLKPSTPSALQELMNMSELRSVLVNVILSDAPSLFAEVHTWNAMGCISFPSPSKEACRQLARQMFDGFYINNEKVALEHLELRFPRRCWDDRMQFWTLAYSVHVKKTGEEVSVIAEDNWKQYLPESPVYGVGVLGKLVDEANRHRLGL